MKRRGFAQMKSRRITADYQFNKQLKTAQPPPTTGNTRAHAARCGVEEQACKEDFTHYIIIQY